ncbi:hypothetical protein BB561_000981 [Smittium simulii]|uniref:Ribosome biogenesis protein ERB1 n=1 Tax=Smittium simulii TaxID=133385 RepID=A0A2T9YWS9_9FUNG|nr:hypothetical protein BB561_000981 [Smittium simulii]
MVQKLKKKRGTPAQSPVILKQDKDLVLPKLDLTLDTDSENETTSTKSDSDSSLKTVNGFIVTNNKKVSSKPKKSAFTKINNSENKVSQSKNSLASEFTEETPQLADSDSNTDISSLGDSIQTTDFEDQNINSKMSQIDLKREEPFEGVYNLEAKFLKKFGVTKEDLGIEPVLDFQTWVDNRKNLPQIEPAYDSDSSTESQENTIGNVPIEWYAEYDHIGYSRDGEKISKPKVDDELDKFLKDADDPAALIKIRDELNQKDIRLTDEEIGIIQRIQQGEFPDATFDPYEDSVEWFTSKTMVTPLTGAPEPKSRFIPSKWEHKMVMRIVRSIRNGKIYKKPEPKERENIYDIWSSDLSDKNLQNDLKRIPPPKAKLPEHNESYHPPAEYLPTEEEKKKWLQMSRDDRPTNFLPKDFETLRHVPAYKNLFPETFQRSLDLYLAPRYQRTKLNIDPESLIPKLPDPKELRPFPTTKSVCYSGHTDYVRCLSVDPTGVWLLTGSEDNSVRLFEISTGFCLKVWTFEDPVNAVSWNPNKDICMFAASSGEKLVLIVPKQVADLNSLVLTETLLKNGLATRNVQTVLNWDKPTTKEQEEDIYLTIDHSSAINQLIWHRKGDYLATLCRNNNSVHIHQISKQTTQKPFSKPNGLVQRVMFHSVKPWFLVATQKYVRIYDLMRQNLVRTLNPGAKWISSIDIHPQGDNIIVGTYDKKVCWFDLDLSSMPYKTIRYHEYAVRQVCFSKAYPLFASCSDDGTIMVFHNTVYSDLMQNPLIVPVKILSGHDISDSLGVLDVTFHPTKPWLFSCGADKQVYLWT